MPVRSHGTGRRAAAERAEEAAPLARVARPASLLLDDEQEDVHVAVVVGLAHVLPVARRLALAPVLLAAAAPEPRAAGRRACARAPRGSSTRTSGPGRCPPPARSPRRARRRRRRRRRSRSVREGDRRQRRRHGATHRSGRRFLDRPAFLDSAADGSHRLLRSRRAPARPCSPSTATTRRRLVLAARPRRPRGARVPRSRERVHRSRARAHERAAETASSRRSGRVQETDVSAPIPHGPWEYYTRTFEGKQYAVHCRRRARRRATSTPTSRSCSTRTSRPRDTTTSRSAASTITPDHRHARLRGRHDTAASATRCGSATSQSGDDLDDVIEDVTTASPGPTTRARASTCGPTTRCARGRCGATRSAPQPTTTSLVFQEDDDRFFVVGPPDAQRPVRARSTPRRRRRPRSGSSRPTTPDAAPTVVAPRAPTTSTRSSTTIDVDARRPVPHRHEQRRRRNFKLVVGAGRRHRAQVNWAELVPHRDDVAPRRRRRVPRPRRAAANAATASSGSGSLTRRRRRNARDRASRSRLHACGSGANAEYDTTTLRYGYTSLVAPVTDVDYDLQTRTATIVKVQPVPAATTRRSTRRHGCGRPARRRRGSRCRSCTGRTSRSTAPRPALLYGYGVVRDLDRPDVPSVATLAARPRLRVRDRARPRRRRARPRVVRGRTPRAQAQHLHRLHRVRGSARRGRVHVARAGSWREAAARAGCSMGAVANLRPDLFAAVVAEVPFVDVVTTMLDPTLPLTITEWEEWGDPREPDAYAWMKAYSPYDNVARRGRTRRCSSRPGSTTRACSTGNRRSGSRSCGRTRRPGGRSSCAPSSAPATADRRAATTRGATKR